jgi:hypothetical protein
MPPARTKGAVSASGLSMDLFPFVRGGEAGRAGTGVEGMRITSETVATAAELPSEAEGNVGEGRIVESVEGCGRFEGEASTEGIIFGGGREEEGLECSRSSGRGGEGGRLFGVGGEGEREEWRKRRENRRRLLLASWTYVSRRLDSIVRACRD